MMFVNAYADIYLTTMILGFYIHFIFRELCVEF